MRKKGRDKVADHAEVLQFLTGLLRGELADAEVGLKERLRAAELLGKVFSGEERNAATEEEMKIEIEVVDGPETIIRP